MPSYALPWPMALRAEPALNQLIWLSLKVWFTGNSYVSPIRLLADHCERLARLEVCQALDADSVEWANLRERKGCQLSNPVCSMPSIIIHAGADCAGRQADGRYKTLSVLSAWIVDSITAPAGEAPLLSSC